MKNEELIIFSKKDSIEDIMDKLAKNKYVIADIIAIAGGKKSPKRKLRTVRGKRSLTVRRGKKS